MMAVGGIPLYCLQLILAVMPRLIDLSGIEDQLGLAERITFALPSCHVDLAVRVGEGRQLLSGHRPSDLRRAA